MNSMSTTGAPVRLPPAAIGRPHLYPAPADRRAASSRRPRGYRTCAHLKCPI